MYDRYLTVFSPEGKLLQVEYAFRTIKNAGINAVAVAGTDGVVVACQRKLPQVAKGMEQDKLMDTSSISYMTDLGDGTATCLIGHPADCRYQAYRLRDTAGEFAHKNGFAIPAMHLAQKLGDHNQMFTQHAFRRILACSAMIIGTDGGKPCIYGVDPAGYTAGYHALASGSKEQEATAILSKLRKKRDYETREHDLVVRDAIEALQLAIGSEFTSNDIEVSEITLIGKDLRRLTDEEIDAHLEGIANADD